MGELRIRPLEPERELDEFLAVFNQGRVRALSRDQWLEFEARSAGHGLHRRLAGRSTGAVVTVGTVDDDPFTSGGVMVWIATGPEHRCQGHGRAMLAAVERVLAERRPAEARAGIRDDDPESRAWAERRGFAVYDHTFASRLDLATFDPAPHRYAVERAVAAGLRFARFGPGDDADRLYELYGRLLRDAPDQLEPPDRAYFQREMVERPGAIMVLAYAGDEPVGLAMLLPRQGGVYGNAITGVLPDHRGRGLARALKVVGAEAARAAGGLTVVTGNNARNAPMLAVNAALGYRREAGILHLHRRTPTV